MIKKVIPILGVLVLTMAAIVPTQAEDMEERIRSLEDRISVLERTGGSQGMKVYWDEGLKIDSADQNFQLEFGGRFFQDWAFIHADNNLVANRGDNFDDGTEFRKIYIEFEGKIYQYIEFELTLDFGGNENSDVELKDGYVGITDVPLLGVIRVGHQREPFSLEEQTSSKYITFMERAAPNIFAPGRNSGILFANHVFENRATWAAGAFMNTDDRGFRTTNEGEYNVTARLTGLPIYGQDGRRLVHVGMSGTLRSPRDDSPEEIDHDTEGEAHLVSENLVNLPDIASREVRTWNPELALIWGPMSVQGEYFQTNVRRRPNGATAYQFDGHYVEASYFLTGENRNYKRKTAKFGRIKPNRNFRDGGWGAFQFAVRKSQTDLNDKDQTGGKLDSWTLGLNWFLNPNTVIKTNYIYSDISDRAGISEYGRLSVIQTRLQIDW